MKVGKGKKRKEERIREKEGKKKKEEEIYISSLPWQSKFFEIIRRIKYNSNVSHFVSCRVRINPANNVTHAFNFTFCTETNPSLTEGTSEE